MIKKRYGYEKSNFSQSSKNILVQYQERFLFFPIGRISYEQTSVSYVSCVHRIYGSYLFVFHELVGSFILLCMVCVFLTSV